MRATKIVRGSTMKKAVEGVRAQEVNRPPTKPCECTVAGQYLNPVDHSEMELKQTDGWHWASRPNEMAAPREQEKTDDDRVAVGFAETKNGKEDIVSCQKNIIPFLKPAKWLSESQTA